MINISLNIFYAMSFERKIIIVACFFFFFFYQTIGSIIAENLINLGRNLILIRYWLSDSS